MPSVHFRVVVDDEFLQRYVVFRQPTIEGDNKDQSSQKEFEMSYLVILLNLSKIGASSRTTNTNGLITKVCSSSYDRTSAVT